MQNKISKLTLWMHKTYLFCTLSYFCDCAKQVCKCFKSSALFIGNRRRGDSWSFSLSEKLRRVRDIITSHNEIKIIILCPRVNVCLFLHDLGIVTIAVQNWTSNLLQGGFQNSPSNTFLPVNKGDFFEVAKGVGKTFYTTKRTAFWRIYLISRFENSSVLRV
jgi:hypothetical protein